MGTWIVVHSQGWQVLLPAIVVFCAAGAVLTHKHAETVLPITFGAVWIASFAAIYLMGHISRFVMISPWRWAALVLMAALGVALPIGAAYVGAALWRRRSIWIRWGVAFGLGLLGILATNYVAGFIGDRVLPFLLAHGA